MITWWRRRNVTTERTGSISLVEWRQEIGPHICTPILICLLLLLSRTRLMAVVEFILLLFAWRNRFKYLVNVLMWFTLLCSFLNYYDKKIYHWNYVLKLSPVIPNSVHCGSGRKYIERGSKSSNTQPICNIAQNGNFLITDFRIYSGLLPNMQLLRGFILERWDFVLSARFWILWNNRCIVFNMLFRWALGITRISRVWSAVRSRFNYW